jgi:hypothetical protein
MRPPSSDATGQDPLDALVFQLVSTTGALMFIVGHMERSISSGRSAPDAPPVQEVLSALLRDVLAPLPERHGRAAIETATTVLAEATEIACTELFLVPISEPEGGSELPSTNGRGFVGDDDD